jgi:hypothetical protein
MQFACTGQLRHWWRGGYNVLATCIRFFKLGASLWCNCKIYQNGVYISATTTTSGTLSGLSANTSYNVGYG